MVKPQFQWIEDQISKQTKVWEERMVLQHWEIEHAFLDSYFGDDGEEDFKITATTESRPDYWQAKIKWYLPSAVRHDSTHIEKTLVHELCHVLLSPEQVLIDARLDLSTSDGVANGEFEMLQTMFYGRLESATEAVTKALWKAYGPS